MLKSCFIVFVTFILIAGITLAIVLPLTLCHHSPRYCSDHDGWQAGQPWSIIKNACRPPYTYVVPNNKVPANYRLVSGGSTPTVRSTSSTNRGSTSTSASRGGGSVSASGSRGRRMIEV